MPGCATAVLIYAGILMMGSVKRIDWSNFKISFRVIAALFSAMLLLTHSERPASPVRRAHRAFFSGYLPSLLLLWVDIRE